MLLPSLVVALSSLAAPTGQPVEAPPRLAVHAVRFYVPSQSQTSILAFLQVPYVLAEAAGDRIAWQVQLQVFDGEGQVVHREEWWGGAPASLRIPEAYSMEALRFPSVAPGRYRIAVTVRDSVSGRTANTETEVVGFASAPMASDLLLASEMRVVAPGDTTTLPGEVGRGNVRFITAPDLVLDGLRPNLAFLVEAYTQAEAVATTRLEIKNRAGTESVYSLAPFEQTIPAGGGVIRGAVPLEGMAEGEYTLHASVTMNGQTVTRTAEFEVGSLAAAMARSNAQRMAARGLDESYFASLSEEELDAAAEALELIAKPSEIAVYKASGDGALTVSAKRQFLVQFWAERDLEKGTPENETRMAFYDAIEFANTRYAESGRNSRPGWKTDRGRIFVKYGVPGEATSFPAANRAPTFEIWRYTTGRMRYYIFADQNNINVYRLIKTNDLEETSAPNWCEILGPEVVRETIEPHLGQRFIVRTGDPNNPNSINQILCN